MSVHRLSFFRSVIERMHREEHSNGIGERKVLGLRPKSASDAAPPMIDDPQARFGLDH